MKKTTFGKRLKELRLKAGLSQSALAAKIGISVFTLQSHEQDRRMFEAPLLIAYSHAVGVSCEAFKDCTSPPKVKQ